MPPIADAAYQLAANAYATASAAQRQVKRGFAKRPYTVINPLTSLTGITANSGAVLSITAPPEPCPNGRAAALKIGLVTSDTFCSARIAASAFTAFTLDSAALVGLWLYWTEANTGQVTILFTSDATFTTKTYKFVYASAVLLPGWNFLPVNPAGTGATEPNGNTWTTAGGFATSDTVNGIEIQFSSTGPQDIYVSDVFSTAGPVSKGAVLFGCDGISRPQNDALMGVLNAAGVHGYIAGDGDLMAANANQLNTYYDAGHDVISSGMYHIGYAASGGNTALLAGDFQTARDILISYGLTRALNFFAYPLSSRNVATDAILSAQGVVMARAGSGQVVTPSPYGLGKIVGHGGFNLGGQTLTTAKARIDRAVAYGVTVNLYCHGLTAGGDGTTPPADTLLWYQADYQALIDYAVTKKLAGTLDIVSPSEWYFARS